MEGLHFFEGKGEGQIGERDKEARREGEETVAPEFYYSKELKTGIQTSTCKHILRTALVTIARK